MQELNWFHLWHKVIYDGIRYSKYSFTLESILNAITKLYPNYHATIPCYWDMHYSNKNNCALNTTATVFKIIHWDSNPMPEEILYRQKVMEYLNLYDGKLLRDKPWICTPPHKRKKFHRLNKGDYIMGLPKKSRQDMCKILKTESEQIYRTYLYYYGTVYMPSTDFETTLVTQLSLDRLDKVFLLLEHWDGPISITVYGTDSQAWNMTKFLFDSGINRKNLAIHVVFRQGKLYPVNILRNVALNTVTTPYAFLNDGDFLPSYGLFSYLKSANKHLMNDAKKRVLVVPAFDGQPGFVYPRNKASLLNKLNNNSIRIFCAWCAHQTHGQTNFSFWAETSHPYKIEWAFHFEPYIVAKRDVIQYDERFVGYGWNKVSQITELKAQGYEFVVIPNGFVVHSPHKHSIDREVWKRKNFKFCINLLWKKFLQDLKRNYEKKLPPVTINIPIE